MVRSFDRVGFGAWGILSLVTAFAAVAIVKLAARRGGFFLSHGHMIVVLDGYSVPIDTCTYIGASGLYGKLPLQDGKSRALTCDGE